MGHTYIKQFIHCLSEIQIILEVLYLANLKNKKCIFIDLCVYKCGRVRERDKDW